MNTRPGITRPPVTPVQMLHLNNKQNKNTNPIISRQDYHLSLSFRGKTNKQKLITNLTLYEAYTNHWTNLRAETKRKKEFNLETWEKETLNTISLKKKKKNRQRNTTQTKEQTRNAKVQINEEEIGKLPEK